MISVFVCHKLSVSYGKLSALKNGPVLKYIYVYDISLYSFSNFSYMAIFPKRLFYSDFKISYFVTFRTDCFSNNNLYFLLFIISCMNIKVNHVHV